ncbi:MFS transporter [Crossiella cryophila]|uniref:MFS family permease n=1 Tax=Crossiella cryophila TaxID=43355 RepID=A0A7W7C6K9_9PSEU|nr:MFS transporter [Crossiella cryophila]MBB4675494.1 MFS family permease [Crossiella cryophila]
MRPGPDEPTRNGSRGRTRGYEPPAAGDSGGRSYPWQDDPDYQGERRTEPVRRRTPPPPPPPPRSTRPHRPPPSPYYPDEQYEEPTAPQPQPEGPTPPKKITVTRVMMWRSKHLTQQAVRAFRRGVHADGARESGLSALTYATMLNYAVDAAIAVAMANTLFFSAASAESKGKVALYLLITVAPFALVAPVVGPLLDRLQQGRRLALGVSFAGRIALAAVMALNFDSWALYPAALGCMVLSRSFGVLKAAVTPRVLPDELDLVKTNSRLTVFGLVASVAFGGIAAGLGQLFGPQGALWFTAAICAVGVWSCVRIPAWVEVTEGEVPATVGAHPKRARQPMGRVLVVTLWANATIRVLTGFLMLFAAFAVKAQTQGEPVMQLLLLGIIGAAAGIGNFLGSAVGARLSFTKPDQLLLVCVGSTLAATVVAAVFGGLTTAAIVGLVGATASALAKVCLDAVVQRDMPEESRASAFGRSETVLQLAWTLGGAVGLLLPPEYWLGFTVVSVLLAVGFTQTLLAGRGSSLIPGFGGDRPLRPATT